MLDKIRTFIKDNYYYFATAIISVIDIVCLACNFQTKLVLAVSAFLMTTLFAIIDESKSFYLVLFILPFRCLDNVGIFKSVGYTSLVCLLFSAVICVRYLIKLIMKREKILLLPFILSCVLMLLGCINFDRANYLDLVMNWVMIATFYVMFVNYKKVNCKSACYSMLVGLALSLCLSGVLYLSSAKRGMVMYYDRFIALTGDPNALQLLCTTLIAVLVCLYHNKKVQLYLFYPLIAVLAMVGLVTKSKSFLICFALIILVHLIFTIISIEKVEKKQSKIFELGIMLLIIGVAMFAFKDQINNILYRFKQTGYSGFFNSITTGRVNIWLTYLKHWASSAWFVIFGVGITAEPLLPVAHCHNDFVYLLYSYGIVGVGVIVALVVFYLKAVNDKKSRFKIINLLPIATICLLAMIECLITSLLFKFLFMLAVGMIFASDNHTPAKSDLTVAQDNQIESKENIKTEEKI